MQIITHDIGDMTAVYTVSDGICSFTVVPAKKKKDLSEEKLFLKGVKYSKLDPLVQVSVFGDPVNRQYSAGQTMRNSESCFGFKYINQQKNENNGVTEIITYLQDDKLRCAEHKLTYNNGEKYFFIETTLINGSKNEITLEMLSSFSIGSLTPFTLNNKPGKMKLHRLRSQWSAEARLESIDAEDLLMEPSWMNYGVRGERFGQRGSFPARPFMPFIAAEDKSANVTWAANIYCASSWQLEYYLSQNSINLSGGLADFEFGHWRKTLAPGEKFAAPKACVTAVCGGVDIAAQRLTETQKAAAVPECEKDLPIIFNDWCKNWGKCSQENLIPLIDAAARFGLDYFVIDAGWFKKATRKGDKLFEPKADFYPDGIEKIVSYINSKGMRAGIWFEYESRDYDEISKVFDGHLLTRGGKVIQNLERAFPDMRDPYVINTYKRDIIDFLRNKGFGYIKTDYNENIGIGIDGAESLGEGLRVHTAAAKDFFKEISKGVPGIVIEVCSSGGMRCEPSMIESGSQMSFSDIHEDNEGAIVAGDMHRVLQPSRSQIWATVREADDENRLVNTIAKAFMGRMCFSGDIEKMTGERAEIIKSAVSFYRRCTGVIKNGATHYLTKKIKSLRNPSGVYAILREGENAALLCTHTFSGAHGEITLKHASLKDCVIDGRFLPSFVTAELNGDVVTLKGMKEASGAVVLFKKVKK